MRVLELDLASALLCKRTKWLRTGREVCVCVILSRAVVTRQAGNKGGLPWGLMRDETFNGGEEDSGPLVPAGKERRPFGMSSGTCDIRSYRRAQRQIDAYL